MANSKPKSTLFRKGRKTTQREMEMKHQMEIVKQLDKMSNTYTIPDDVKIPPKITKREQLTAELIAFYRQRPDVCCEDLLGIKLNLYQKLLIRGSWNKRFVMWLLSRGLAKSWTGMVFLVLKAMLYRKILLGIIAPSFAQARRVLLDKLEREIMDLSPMLLLEKDKFPKSQDDTSITFFNGSRIKAVSSGQGDKSSQRGDRFQVILADEYAQLKKEVIDRVINPSMNNKANYKVGQKNKDGFKNQLIIASTSFYRFNHLWEEFKIYLNAMLESDNDYVIFAFPYQVGIDVGLYDEVFIAKEKRRLSKEDFEMEYCNCFPAVSDNSWIDPRDVEACACLNTFYLYGNDEYETCIGVDVARTPGGDNTAMHVGRLLPQKNGDIDVDIVRTVTMNGATFAEQHKMLRSLLKDYPRTIRIGMDIQGLSKGLYDECIKPYWDAELQKELPPLIDMNDKQAIANIKNGILIIYGILGSAELNHNMGLLVKKYTQKRRIRFYHAGTSNDDGRDLTLMEAAQIAEARATQVELLKIEAKPSGNYLKFDLPDTMKGSKFHRKDRWSACGHLLYVVNQIEEERQEGEDCGSVAMSFAW
jgi:hypothetical protein